MTLVMAVVVEVQWGQVFQGQLLLEDTVVALPPKAVVKAILLLAVGEQVLNLAEAQSLIQGTLNMVVVVVEAVVQTVPVPYLEEAVVVHMGVLGVLMPVAEVLPVPLPHRLME